LKSNFKLILEQKRRQSQQYLVLWKWIGGEEIFSFYLDCWEI